MHPRTEATLEKLRQAQWFRCVGVHDTKAAEILSSWQAAIESCGSADWEDLCLEAANQYHERLAERAPQRFQEWNEIVLAIKPVVIDLVREKIKHVVEENDLPLSNLYVTILQRLGIDADKFGSSTGTLTGLHA